MSSAKLLQRISIKSPCSANWNEMTGNEQVRFCSHCDQSVRDLSQLTRPEAIELVLRSKGNICLRIHRNPSGEIITGRQKVHVISRRASKLAVGAFTAVISLSAAAQAQTPASGTGSETPAVALRSQEPNSAGTDAVITGKVVDPNGAVVPGAQITVVNDLTNEVRVFQNDDAGEYRVSLPGDGTYSVSFEVPGFATLQVQKVVVKSAVETRLDAAMQPAGEYVTVGGGAMVEYETPLLKAAQANDLATVKQLIREGVAINQVEDGNTTALDLAVANGNLKIIKRLLRAGADPNGSGENRESALYWLGQENSTKIVPLLIGAGANIDQGDSEGNTALMRNAGYSNGETVKALLDAGAYVNAQNEDGETALMLAARSDNAEVIKALLAAGAAFTMRNAAGKDAIQLARENDSDEAVELLLAAGAVDTSPIGLATDTKEK